MMGHGCSLQTGYCKSCWDTFGKKEVEAYKTAQQAAGVFNTNINQAKPIPYTHECTCIPYGPYNHTADGPYAEPDHDQAKRYNAGKPDLTLIPAEALLALAQVLTFGAFEKPRPDGSKGYGRENWRKLWGTETVNVILASSYRHHLAIQRGEDTDPESGLPHAAHVMANMSFLIWALKNNKEIR